MKTTTLLLFCAMACIHAGAQTSRILNKDSLNVSVTDSVLFIDLTSTPPDSIVINEKDLGKIKLAQIKQKGYEITQFTLSFSIKGDYYSKAVTGVKFPEAVVVKLINSKVKKFYLDDLKIKRPDGSMVIRTLVIHVKYNE
jgi:hypothetical protein